nr:hypothetical protein [Tanacetum cinerariifolium]
ILEQNERFRAENKKVKQHYKELYDSIKITRANTNENTSYLLTEVQSLKAQLKGKTKCVTVDPSKQKFLLLESVETVREIVKEARLEKTLDNVLASACSYMKHSRELLEYVIGTCPKESIKRDNKAAITPLTRIKQVTFNDTCGTLTNNT